MKRVIEKKHDLAILGYVLIFVFVRYLCFGSTYFYQLDDYIQYWAYPNRPDRWGVVLEQGLLSSRPLAGLSDLYIWGAFFDNMIVAVFIISLLYACSAVLFLKVFRKHFNTGFMFCVFYALCPFFFEAVYWVSASSRIVVGLFFTALSVFFLQKIFDTKMRRYTPVFFITQALSLCFYEQVFILSCVLNFIIIIFNSKDNKKYILYSLILIFNALMYFVITAIFKNSGSALGNRMSIIIPSFSKWYIDIVKDLFAQIGEAFINVPFSVMFLGFLRGIKITVLNNLWNVIVSCIVLCVITLKLVKSETAYNEKSPKGTFVWGIVLFVLPISVFFIIANPYISMRNIVPCYVGLAIIFDMGFSCLKRNQKNVSIISAVLICLIFFISSVSEIHDYKQIFDFDTKVSKKIEMVMKKNNYQYKTGFIIQSGDRGRFNRKFHEHGAGVTSSDWALWGILNYFDYENKLNNKKAVPIETDNNIYHYRWDKEAKKLSGFEKLYYWNENADEFTEVFLKEQELITEDEQTVAMILEHNNTGYIFFN